MRIFPFGVDEHMHLPSHLLFTGRMITQAPTGMMVVQSQNPALFTSADPTGDESGSKFVCPLCRKVFLGQTFFNDHYADCSKRRHVCQICGHRATRATHLRSHMKVHQSESLLH